MQIIKNQESKYGNFDLLPAKGHVLDRHFIDFESGLLIVGEHKPVIYKRSPLKNGIIRPRYTIIDTAQQKILKKDDLAAIFSYETREIEHPEHQLKTITTRVHDDKRNMDGFESRLVNTQTGEVISRSESAAFREAPPSYPPLYESYLNDLEERKKEAAIRYGEYLDEWYEQDLAQLKDGLLMQYMSQEKTFDLILKEGRCFLYQALNLESDVPANSGKTLLNSFDSPDDFWNWFVRQPNWYLTLQPLHVDKIFARSLINYINDLLKRRALDFNNEQHYQIYSWTEKVMSDRTEHALTQYCVRCGARVMYYPRYPRYICKDCVQLLTRRDGKPLDWKKVYWRRVKSKTGKVRVYIGKEVYWAEEARFGGTVVQK